MNFIPNSTTPPQGWSAPSENTLTRPFDTIEKWQFAYSNIYSKSLDRDAYGITLGLKLKLPNSLVDPVRYLKRTWLVLWHRHPMLSAIYPPASAKDSQQCITVGPLSTEKWLQTFVVHDNGPDSFQKRSNAVQAIQPQMMPTAHWVPATCEFIIKCSHQRIDFLGMLKLANSVMTILSSVIQDGLDADLETYHADVALPTLGPGIDAMQGSQPSTSRAACIQKVVDKMLEEGAKAHMGLSLPIRQGSYENPPTGNRCICVEFDEAASKEIRATCVNRGISIASAMNTSLVRLIASFPQHPDAKYASITVVTDFRKLLHPCYLTPDYAVGLNANLVPFRIPDIMSTDISFGPLSTKIAAMYATNLAEFGKDEEGKPISYIDVAKHCLEFQAASWNASKPTDVLSIGSPAISSLGLLEKYLGREFGLGENKCEVEDVFCAVDSTWTPIFYVFTFQDKLRVQVSYNETYYEEEFMGMVLEKIKMDLMEGLNICLRTAP